MSHPSLRSICITGAVAVVLILTSNGLVTADGIRALAPKNAPRSAPRGIADKSGNQGMTREAIIVRKGDEPMGVSLGMPQQVRERPWVEWSISSTALTYAVRTPGRYASRWGAIGIRSNSAVILDFDHFGDLKQTTDGRSMEMELGVAEGATNPNQVNFCSAGKFNEQDIHLTKAQAGAFQCDLWCRVNVTRAVGAGDYERKATITVALVNGYDWTELTDETSK